MNDIIKFHKDLLSSALSLGADEAEVFTLNSNNTKITVRNNDVEDIHKANEQGLALRIFKNKKLGFYYTTNLDTQNIKHISKAALDNALENEADENNGLNNSKKKTNIIPNIYDQNLIDTTINQKIELAKSIESSAKNFDKRVLKTEYVSFDETIYTIFLTNSFGFENTYKGTVCGGMAELIAEENNLMETGSGFSFSTHLNQFDPHFVGKEAAQDAISMLGAVSIPSQTIPVVLDSRVSMNFLSVIAPMFSADAIQKNKSKLMGKLNTKIASDKVSIVDDSTQDMLLGSFPFDAEGTVSQKKVLIENGVLKGYLHNNYTAKKDKTISTGNASRISFKMVPDIFPTNLYISPGKQKPEDLIKNITKGIYLTRVIGLHTADPITGDFSLGAQGILIENGKKTKPVRKFAIAGNLLDILNDIEAIANDLRFMPLSGNIGSPTILIKEMKISG